jgi:hypothetical protein
LEQILESLSVRRSDPSIKSKIPTTLQGGHVDCSVPVQQLGLTEITLSDPSSEIEQPESCRVPAKRFRSPNAASEVC